jgi:hypothetical protein
MPIEFRCSQCGKLLRTGDETVGRQAQCPQCGGLSKVPGPAEAAGASPPLAPLGAESAAAGSPFRPGSVVGVAPGQADPSAAQRVSAPATALIVMAILSMCLQVLGIIGNAAQMAIGPAMAPHRHEEALPMMFSAGVGVVLGVFALAISVVVLIGARKMKSLESYGFAMAAAIIAVIPCVSPCCLLGLPFGIWALVVLSDSSVKAAFRS